MTIDINNLGEEEQDLNDENKENIQPEGNSQNVEDEESAESAQIAQPVSGDDVTEEDFGLFDTPTIPKAVYQSLPELLKHSCEMFDTAREKDVYLTGALTILSGCFDSVDGEYFREDVYPNLNCFIIAPAASGKGAFVYAKKLGDALHDKLLEESEALKRKYNASQRQTETSGQLPIFEGNEKPPFKILFIPGNSSAPAIIKHLMEGDGKGIFCETEADTLANSLKQDWGNFSDLLRKAFHHETISYSRKTESEFMEIKKPRLSVALTGTPNQVEGLISSAEDGLFSRFIFYVFSVKPEWRSVAPVAGRANMNDYFNDKSLRVLKIVEYLRENPSRFDFTKEQWKQVDERFSLWLADVYDLLGDEALSSIKRLGMIAFRIGMVLTCLRKFEKKGTDLEITCSEEDFKTAMELVEVYKEHSFFMFNRLPQTGSVSERMVKQFFGDLPKDFKRSEALTIGKLNGIEERTVDKYLKMLLASKHLFQPKYGSYSKK